MRHIHHYIHLIFSTDLIAPLALIIFYVVFLIFIRGVAPSSDEIIAHAQDLYSRYGYELIFFGAAFEGLVFINLLAPGSLTVGLSAIFASTGTLNLAFAILSAFLGAMIAYTIDYLLGFYGFGKIVKRMGYGQMLKPAKNKLNSSPIESFSFGFIHPNIEAVVALAAGAVGINFFKFLLLSGISSAAWIIFWGIVIYMLGEVFLKLVSKYFPLIVILLILIWTLSILYSKNKTKK